jgi:protein CrcB
MTASDVPWVGLGGGLGSLPRWWVGRAVGERWHGDFPLGTLLINISGAFPMGYLSVLFAVDWHTRHGTAPTALCLTGIIGGYTTLSRWTPSSWPGHGVAPQQYCPTTSTCCSAPASWVECRRFRALSMAALG